MDVDARMQLFDLKKKYQFQTTPVVDRYNMPLYSVQTESGGQSIGMYPVYQGFLSPAYINGIQVPLQSQRSSFFSIWPNIVQNSVTGAIGDGTPGPYTITFPISPGNQTPINVPVNSILRGHIDMSGIIATGNNQDPPLVTAFNTTIPVTSVESAVYITALASDGTSIVAADSGQFLVGDANYGLLMTPGNAPFGNAALPGGYSTTSNTINYFTGVATLTFPVNIPSEVAISAEWFYFQTGLPRAILFYNNTLTLRSPPDRQYLVEMDAYLSPAAFLNTEEAIPFGYMAEYLARGAARKILSDTGDIEQFQFYEPLFKEQELLVWKRSQRQFTNDRTQTIYSQRNLGDGQFGYNSIGGST
jgi:hypothetical protein